MELLHTHLRRKHEIGPTSQLNVAEAHPKTSSKNTSLNVTLLRFVIIFPIMGKT